MAIPASSPAPVQDFWAEYMLKELVGQGKYGKVWRCVERRTGRAFACKELSLANGRRKKVLAEVEAMSALDGHPNVVRLHEVYEESGIEPRVFLILTLCSGGDLFDAIRENGEGMDERVARPIFLQVAQAVHYIHTAGFVHRDLKPENVFLHWETKPRSAKPDTWRGLTDQLTAQIGDFGLAVRVPDDGDGVRGRAGSVPYSAPEVQEGDAHSFAADVWSLGVTLCAMLTASWPELDEANQLLPRDAQDQWQGLSSEAEDLIRSMVALSPSERLTMDKVLQHPWLAGSPLSPPPSAEDPLMHPSPAWNQLPAEVSSMVCS